MASRTLNTSSGASYANGIDFWRRQNKKTWRELADESKVSLPVLRRTAQTGYTIFVQQTTGQEIALPVSGSRNGVLATDKLRQVSLVLHTNLSDLLATPETLQKNFTHIT